MAIFTMAAADAKAERRKDANLVIADEKRPNDCTARPVGHLWRPNVDGQNRRKKMDSR